MKLANLDQQIFVPITDETNGGMTYEMGMSLGDFLKDLCEGFKPEVVEAIPVEWLKHMISVGKKGSLNNTSIEYVLEAWRIEQEAKMHEDV